MIELIFDESGSLIGFSETGVNESEGEVVREFEGSKLSDLVSNREKDWRSLVSGFYLSNGELNFDSGYSTEQSGA